MDPQFAPPQKKVPLLKSTYSQPTGRPNQSRLQGRTNKSPDNSVYSYAPSQANSSTQYTAINKPSVNSSKGGPASSYQSTTQSAQQKASLSEYRQFLRNKSKQQEAHNLPIDIHYDQWNRFENFLKFASKKEIRDRLKELDPPPLENYIDPDVIDKIKAASKPPPALKRKNILEPAGSLSAKEENRQRIEKMKKLYGLYKQFQEQEEASKELTLPEVKPSPQKEVNVKLVPKKQEEVILP